MNYTLSIIVISGHLDKNTCISCQYLIIYWNADEKKKKKNNSIACDVFFFYNEKRILWIALKILLFDVS